MLSRDKFYYVPFLKTLKQLLQIDYVRNEVLRPVQSKSIVESILAKPGAYLDELQQELLLFWLV